MSILLARSKTMSCLKPCPFCGCLSYIHELGQVQYINMLDELEVIQGVGAGSNQRFTPDIYLGTCPNLISFLSQVNPSS